MKFLFDFFPVIVFFVVFKLYGIYAATAASIAAAFLQVGGYWLRHRRFERMHLFTLAILVVFGGLTLALRDDTFIKWKPTLVYWILAALVLGSQVIGKQTAIQRLLGKQLTLPPAVWARQNFAWGVFFLALGALNLYVAFYYAPHLDAASRQEIWVNFKVFGLLGLTLAFTVLQALWMARHLKPESHQEPR